MCSVSFLKTPRKRLAVLLYLLDGRSPSLFPLYLGVYIFHEDHKPVYIGIKILVLPPTQLVFTVIELTILQQILRISA